MTSPMRAALAALTLTFAAAAPLSASAKDCERTCLRQALDGYLAAVVKHDPKAAPLAAKMRETQNAVVTTPGDGVWKSAKALGAVQRRYLDPVSGQAAYFGLLDDGATAIVAVRVKVADRKITEAEWIIGRPLRSGSTQGLTDLPPQEKAAPGAKVSRAQMTAAANSYFEGLTRHDSTVVRSTPDCNRIENGTRMTGVARMSAEAAAASGPPALKSCSDKLEDMKQIADVAYRRFPVVDEEAGVVMGIGLFHRPPGQPKGRFDLRNLLTEFFALKDGKITAIYAAMTNLPPEAPDGTGWPP